jgi:hypothetical protein
MAFPQIVTYNSGTSSSSSLHEIIMPSSVVAGNLLIAFFTCHGTVDPLIDRDSGLGWNVLYSYQYTNHFAGVYYKYVLIPDYDDLFISLSGPSPASFISYQISGMSDGVPGCTSVAVNGSTNADPQSITPGLGTQDYLWLVCAAIDGDIIASAAPSSFSGLITAQSTSVGSSSSSAYREYNTGSSYNPGAFTSAYGSWIAITIVIAPKAADGVGITRSVYYGVNSNI